MNKYIVELRGGFIKKSRIIIASDIIANPLLDTRIKFVDSEGKYVAIFEREDVKSIVRVEDSHECTTD